MNQKKENKPTNNKLNLLISCYEVPALEMVVKQIVRKLEELKLNYSGPIPLPRKRKIISVLCSPHKHKISQEHLGRIVYRRSIQIFLNALTDLNFAEFASSKLQLPGNIDIKLKQS